MPPFTHLAPFKKLPANSVWNCAKVRAGGRMLTAVSVAVGMTAMALVPDAAAQKSNAALSVNYQMLIAGAPAGKLDLTARLAPSSYTVQASGGTTGLIDVFARIRFNSSSAGKVRKSLLRPERHEHSFSERGKQRQVTLVYDKAGRPTVTANPAFEPSLSRVPLAKKQMHGTVDPSSVFLAPAVAGVPPLDPAQCNRSVSVMDGRLRLDMEFQYREAARNEKFKGSNYQGPILRCVARVRPVGGHRKKGFLADLAKRKGIDVWLAPVAGGMYLIPLRVSLPTPIGTAELRARRLVVEPSAHRASLGN